MRAAVEEEQGVACHWSMWQANGDVGSRAGLGLDRSEYAVDGGEIRGITHECRSRPRQSPRPLCPAQLECWESRTAAGVVALRRFPPPRQAASLWLVPGVVGRTHRLRRLFGSEARSVNGTETQHRRHPSRKGLREVTLAAWQALAA